MTLLQETAHVALHVDALPADDYQQHRGLAECEAESVAYGLAGMAGLDATAYSDGYIATWTHGDTDLIRATAGHVLTAVEQLANAFTDNDTDPPVGDHKPRLAVGPHAGVADVHMSLSNRPVARPAWWSTSN